VRFLQCFHPLEAVEGTTIRVSSDSQGDNPSINSDGNDVTIATTALGMVELGKNTSSRIVS
jgi:hypothetical protein